jgi:hypothetical protein
VVVVVTLLAYGCPVQAIVAAFGLDERTVARWQARAGTQCRRVHGHLVQADELRVQIVGGALWLASAIPIAASANATPPPRRPDSGSSAPRPRPPT